MNQSDLRKWIEACRSEEDLALPEAAPLAEQLASDPELRRTWHQVRRQDEAIRSAVRQVTVPEGLEQRILQRLGQPNSLAQAAGPEPTSCEASISQADAAINAAADAAEPGEIGVSIDSSANPIQRRERTGRWRLWAGSLVGIATILIGAVTLLRQPVPTLDNELELVLDWTSSLQESEWSNVDPPLRTFPLPSKLAVLPFQWQQLAKRRGTPQVVCYEFPSTGQHGPRAFLFVVLAAPRESLPSVPPRNPYRVPPWSVGAWKGTSAVYLLAVHGGADEYRRLLRFGPPPVVWRSTVGKSYLAGNVHVRVVGA